MRPHLTISLLVTSPTPWRHHRSDQIRSLPHQIVISIDFSLLDSENTRNYRKGCRQACRQHCLNVLFVSNFWQLRRPVEIPLKACRQHCPEHSICLRFLTASQSYLLLSLGCRKPCFLDRFYRPDSCFLIRSSRFLLSSRFLSWWIRKNCLIFLFSMSNFEMLRIILHGLSRCSITFVPLESRVTFRELSNGRQLPPLHHLVPLQLLSLCHLVLLHQRLLRISGFALLSK